MENHVIYPALMQAIFLVRSIQVNQVFITEPLLFGCQFCQHNHHPSESPPGKGGLNPGRQ